MIVLTMHSAIPMMANAIVVEASEVKSVRANVRQIAMARNVQKNVNAKMEENVITFRASVTVQRDLPDHCKTTKSVLYSSMINKFNLNFRCQEKCTYGENGKECRSLCKCQNGGICIEDTKQCKCPPGWTGDVCANRCQPGRYGANCTQTCECFNGASCGHVNGKQ